MKEFDSIKELILYISRARPKLNRVLLKANNFDSLELEMSHLLKLRELDVWEGTSDGILATYVKDIPEENFLCKGIPIIRIKEEVNIGKI